MKLEFGGKTIDLLEKLYACPQLIHYRKSYLSMLRLRDDCMLLDVGIGTAANTLLVLDQFPRMKIVGADRSFEMLQHSHNKLRDRTHTGQVRFLCLDAHRPGLRLRQFDYAVVSQVLSYVEDPILVLRRLKTLLKPTGRVLVEDSDWEVFTYISGDFRPWEAIRECWKAHCVRVDAGRRLPEFAQAAGWNVEEFQTYHLQDLRFEENCYSYWLAKMIADHAIRNHAVTQSEAETWLSTLQRLSEAGSYYFSLARMSLVAS